MGELRPGQLVRSRAGRDAGKYYFVWEKLDEGYYWVVDGKYKPIEKPKKKNIIHLQKHNYVSHGFVRDKESGKIMNSDIIYYLKKAVQAEG